MQNMSMLKRTISALAWMALAFLAACGGGGGSAGNSSGGETPTYVVAVALSTQTVTAAQPAVVTASVKSNTGVALVGQVVTFSTRDKLGVFSSSTALTDGNGVATVTLSPSSASTAGADVVTASVTVSGNTYTASTGFQLTATNVSITSFSSDIPALTAYGQTQLSVVLAGVTSNVPVNVSVSSSCVTQGRATLTPSDVSTTTGRATFTYRDQGCGAFNGTDGLQASVAGTSATASLSLTLTSPAVASIAFVSASPSSIYLRGSGFVENSNVTFQVRDANGLGVPNQSVVLEATTLAGGLLIDGGSVPVTKVSDSEGKVLVRVNAGTVPTPVRIKATLTSAGVSTVSSSLAVAVGLPSQQNFSMSQGTFNLEGASLDGQPNTYTIIASDRLGNPVPEGTAINFVAEGGQVQAIRFTTLGANGLAQAVANFQTSTPRPTDGRVTVLAYALGEESFLDTNGNNVYDNGEDYQDLGDIFLDRLFNGSYNAAEDQFISLSVAGTDACRTATSALLQLGVEAPSRSLSSTGAALNTCVAGWGKAYVRKAVQTVFAQSTARIGWLSLDSRAWSFASPASCPALSLVEPISGQPAYESVGDAPRRVPFHLLGQGVALRNLGANGVIGFLVADTNALALNPMPARSTVSASATQGLSVGVSGGTVPNTLQPSSSALLYAFEDGVDSGTISVTITSPAGVASLFAIPVYRNTPSTGAACP